MADNQLPHNPKELSQRLGVVLDPDLLEVALTHRSYAYEHQGVAHNERLEFLGDAVLGLAVTDYLYVQYPQLSEGDLAKKRSAVVSSKSLAIVGRSLHLGNYLRLGKGEENTGGRSKDSILADTMEALFGACHISRGPQEARDMVLRLMAGRLQDSDAEARDWKTEIQEYAAAHQLGPVRYEIIGEGPDHARSFQATLYLGKDSYATGSGSSKKTAEQAAAELSWQQLDHST